ncbi:Uma2 family endonuclease [Nocardia pseudobrasiliensis]|uniref:Uma2 family endonuclease n=1 Tax=Nocardia pseudobrasiliensis TaxID=45979 RepID=UPI0008329E5F|nr:Uma2 family endonuclease [Nocardia pseudobrasiliensis]
MGVIDRDAARTAHEANTRTFYGRDLLLVAEVVSRRSGSEHVDRVDKIYDYAHAGIGQYWIIDLEPHPRIEVHVLIDGEYGSPTTVHAGDVLSLESPFPISIDPAVLLDVDSAW